LTEPDILVIGSKLNSAYLSKNKEKQAKPSSPTSHSFLKTKTDHWAIVPNISYLDIAHIFLENKQKGQNPHRHDISGVIVQQAQINEYMD
jgi:hypothetical protein